MNRKLSIWSAMLVLALLVVAPVARAQSPTLQGYGEDRGIVQQVQHASSNPTPPRPRAVKASSSSGAKLPFTGLDLAIVVGLGVVLAGTGVVLRRSARPSEG